MGFYDRRGRSGAGASYFYGRGRVAQLLMVILPDRLWSERVMDAWMETGVTGVTILTAPGSASRANRG
jgi:hypothetical protein